LLKKILKLDSSEYMRRHILIGLLFFSSISFAQKTMTELLKKYNTEDIPYISVQELAMPKTDAILLDARELKEYEVSHLKHAMHVGYDHFDLNTVLKNIPKTSTSIVVYCSVGIRSEAIAQQLKKAGYSNVYNLFGGIFEWKNHNLPVYNCEETETENVHAYSKDWGQWLLKGNKIYD